MLGEKFGRWTVIDEIEINRKVLCECECGNEKMVDKKSLKNGKSKSCGCFRSELIAKKSTKHGYGNRKNNRLFRIWIGMRDRCNRSNAQNYKYYGGRGICVCDEWSDFTTFREWSLENGYSDELSIDRIDNDGNYEASNCRWTNTQEQGNNKRSNIYFHIDGEKLTLTEISKRTGISYQTLHTRYQKGHTTYEEIIKPVKRRSTQ